MGHYSRGCTNEKPADDDETNDAYPSADPTPAGDGPAWGSGATEAIIDDGW